MTPSRREWTIGENILWFEPPDLLRGIFKGPCSLREAIQIVDLFRELASARPIFMMVDMAEAGAMALEARHYFTEHFQTAWLLGMISYKTRLLHKGIMMGLRLAIELTRTEENPLLGKIHFVSTLEKAEALLAELREG